MSLLMTEKKAQELFAQYMKAETAGDDTQAISLEKQLNDAGWYITSGPDGLTVKKKSTISIPSVDPSLLPQDTKVTPVKVDPNEPNPNRKIWIIAGVSLGALAVIIVLIIIIKRVKNGNA